MALTQFLLWIILTIVLVTAVSAVAGSSMMAGSDAAEIMEMVKGTGGVEGLDMASMTEDSDIAVVLSTLANIPWGTLVTSFLIYFILGYLLYASLYAAIGASVENVEDSQQLQLPVTVPLMIGYMIVFMAFRSPDSPAVFWGSMVPFTSPIVMLARIPYGVPFWQLALSIGLLLLTFIGCAWASAKIYKAGILIFGKKASFKDMWKWLKQK